MTENPLVHSFEKVRTTDDYHGGNKSADGDDELAEHEDSLEELELRKLIRTPDAAGARLRADYALDIDIADSEAIPCSYGLRRHIYDEWNESSQSYLKGWCRLEEKISAADGISSGFDPDTVRAKRRRQIEEITRTLFSLFRVPFWSSRRPDGDELDLDGAVDHLSTPPQSRPEVPRVYMARQRRIEDLAIVLLIDLSLSSDSWVREARVLDTIKESIVILGEGLRNLPLTIQLAGFSSMTRNRIDYEVLKTFDEPWKRCFERLAPLEPRGYTRIGPPLRHAKWTLEQRRARHKWIFLMSDAKPTDYDRYEGRHGIRDVRKAVAEIRRGGMEIKCLSIESIHRPDLYEMFGPRGYELLPNPADLPQRLTRLIRDLLRAHR
ncbi:MAG: hypothetical protein HC902_12200 [Calothrix sp. SM1_5_4]|nr:hypothetical protein [Calothrix sp. SM1_5_4]